MNYLTVVKDLSNIISIEDVIKKFKNNYKQIINVYGSFEAFKKDQEESNSDLRSIKFLGSNKYLFEKVKEEKAFLLVCRANYFNYLKQFIIYFIDFFNKRKDLKFSARIKMSYYKAKRNVIRTKHCVDIDKYFWKTDLHDEIIKDLFNKKLINNIYIYRGKNPIYGIKSKVIERMEKEYKKDHPYYDS